ncbi:hypothetical protein GCM10010174_15900 [Kutzneria viridogrisea]|uniref:Pimeloyl-ACP methyl ester carboxylesterase n=1 Tax=Kutzneria viridogrisea TaxID=47990 RepID=A0ABR6BHD3_9PSEU|nr:pimeloyl-ACP methyl ester carboxylesterase [Kutzneria viridogrisea]
MREDEVLSTDGTRIRTWSTESAGPPVLLCPGLGTVPESWPGLLLPDCGVRVHSWYHRGTMGSARPADPARVALDDHVADALAVLDATGVERCVVLGWSVGVMVGAELALRHPDRVTGLMLAAGTPGDFYAGVGGPFGLPTGLRRELARGGTQALRLAGPLLDLVTHRFPVNGLTMTLLRHSGFMLPGSTSEAVVAMMRRFRAHDWRWYFTLAAALAAEPAQDLSGLRCPVTLLSGRYDVLADAATSASALAALPQARMRVLPTTHFLPLEAPEVVREELSLLLDRVATVRRWHPLTPDSRQRT